MRGASIPNVTIFLIFEGMLPNALLKARTLDKDIARVQYEFYKQGNEGEVWICTYSNFFKADERTDWDRL